MSIQLITLEQRTLARDYIDDGIAIIFRFCAVTTAKSAMLCFTTVYMDRKM